MVPLSLKFSGISMWRWQLQTQMETQWKQQEAMNGGSGETDMIRQVLLDTDPWLLGITSLPSHVIGSTGCSWRGHGLLMIGSVAAPLRASVPLQKPIATSALGLQGPPSYPGGAAKSTAQCPGGPYRRCALLISEADTWTFPRRRARVRFVAWSIVSSFE